MSLLINKIITDHYHDDPALRKNIPLQGKRNHDKETVRRHAMKEKILLWFAAVLLLSSYAHAISEQYRETAVKGVGFKQILADPDPFINSVFIFGGTIVDTSNTKEGSEIELLQNPIDRYGDITDTDISEGRLIILTPRLLDPLIYKRGRTLTFAGKLIGTREKKFLGIEYRYPVFEAEQLHLWKPVPYYYAPYPWWWGDPFYSPYYPDWYGPIYRPYYYPYW
jgi:outer membrane lipoprotein